MTITVHIPGALREFTDGHASVSVETGAATVGGLLADLWTQHPGVRDRVVTERGRVRPHVNVFVGRESIRFTGELNTPITDGDEVSIVPAVSGG